MFAYGHRQKLDKRRKDHLSFCRCCRTEHSTSDRAPKKRARRSGRARLQEGLNAHYDEWQDWDYDDFWCVCPACEGLFEGLDHEIAELAFKWTGVGPQRLSEWYGDGEFHVVFDRQRRHA